MKKVPHNLSEVRVKEVDTQKVCRGKIMADTFKLTLLDVICHDGFSVGYRIC